MASKTVNLSEQAYARLQAIKREGESFSDVINRLTGKYAVLDLIGVLTEEQAKEAHERLASFRARMRRDFDARARSLDE
jgi:predicted CopG family antitoxin